MRTKTLLRSLIGSILLTGTVLVADVKLPAIFCDKMVIQRESDAPVWGWATAGEKVTVKGSWGDSVEAITPRSGKWELKLKTPKAGGPFTITVQGKNQIELKDVLSGDVWLCAGQSNMAFKMKNTLNSKTEIKQANYPEIRLLTVTQKMSLKPLDNTSAKWVLCRPESVVQFSAVAYFFGRDLYQELKIPIGLINASWGGTNIESWMPWSVQKNISASSIKRGMYEKLVASYNEKAEREKYEQQLKEWNKIKAELSQKGSKGQLPRRPRLCKHPHKNKNYPAMLYNGMIKPICPYGIKGVIWYQGEGNCNQYALDYGKQLKALISSWRQEWGLGDFSFYFVQLPNFKSPSSKLVQNGSWPRVREAFRMAAQTVPNTGLAVTIDIGDADDVHPENKQDVGNRLARLALKKTYHKKAVVWTGPILKKISLEGNKAVVTFENGGSPLAVKGDGELKGFALIGEKGKPVAAKATITGPETIELKAPGVKKIAMVYYAWAYNPATANLVNKAGLPASPFRWGKMPVLKSTHHLPEEAKNYQLVYQLDPTNPKMESGHSKIKYQVDKSSEIKGPFKKIAYFLSLKDANGSQQKVFISMDPFTDDVKKIGVPVKDSGARFQQHVNNCFVKSNVKGVKNGTFTDGCNIEFWDCNYGKGNRANVPGASSKLLDFGDFMVPKKSPGYGCMQVHNFKEKQAIFCFNNFNGQRNADIGIGNRQKGNPDWTFSKSAKNFTQGIMMILVLK